MPSGARSIRRSAAAGLAPARLDRARPRRLERAQGLDDLALQEERVFDRASRRTAVMVCAISSGDASDRRSWQRDRLHFHRCPGPARTTSRMPRAALSPLLAPTSQATRSRGSGHLQARGRRAPERIRCSLALVACFASSWTPAMVRRWHADPFGFLRPWNEVPALMGSAPPATPPSTGTGVVTFLMG